MNNQLPNIMRLFGETISVNMCNEIGQASEGRKREKRMSERKRERERVESNKSVLDIK